MTHIMVIAGSDSSGGAGITRDIATATALGYQVTPVVTAVTAQTNSALKKVHPVPAPIIAGQINCASVDNAVGAIKIGMLGSTKAVSAVTMAIISLNKPIVLDPILRTSSGGQLHGEKGFGRLLHLATLVTPNLDEAAALTDTPLARHDADIATQAQMLLDQGAKAVLIKGGHGTGDTTTDQLFCAAGHHRFTAPRLPLSQRGTGCTLSTAIACYLGSQYPLPAACEQAAQHVQTWLKSTPAPLPAR